MRLLLVGQRSFGAAVYEAIRTRTAHQLPLIVAPDEDDRLFQAALRDGEAVRHAGLVTAEDVRRNDIDLIVAAHSHAYLGRRTRAASRLGAIGYHPSLLPRHRGRDAVRWTVAMRDPIAGGSVYWFDDQVDHGPVAAQDWCHVGPRETYQELWRDKLFPMGVRLLLQVLDDLDRGVMVQIPQDEAYASWEPSWDRPPLYRPELPEIGAGPEGFRVVAHPAQLRAVV